MPLKLSLKPGEKFVQPELAATLARIKADPREFYEGDTARKIVSAWPTNCVASLAS